MASTKEAIVVLERLPNTILKNFAHVSGTDEVQDKRKSKGGHAYSVLSKKIHHYEVPKSETNILNNLNIPNSSQSKKYFCIFCKKMYSKLVKHLEAKHKEEPDVKKITVFPKGNKERLKIIDNIRKKGAFEHNTDKNYNKGVLIVTRRPKPDKSKNGNDYRTCPNCKGFFSKTSIRRHYPKCFPQKQKNDHMMLKYGNKVLSNVHSKACPTLRDKIFPVFRDDNVVNIIRYDELVMVYGNYLCSKYRSKHLHNMIRARLRGLGRFILEIRKIDDTVTCFSDIYVPQKFDNVINAINNVAQLDDTGTQYKAPATASNLTTVIKFCGELWIIECIKKQDSNKKVLAEDFLSIFKKDVLASINKTVTENQLERKRKKKIVLPSMDDIKLLKEYLDTQREKAYKNLEREFNYDAWLELGETTLTSIQVFNRRRAGEMERVTIDDFNTCEKIDKENEDVYKSLSEEEKNALDTYYRFVIRGKLGRGVPVLIRNELYLSIKLLLLHREEAGVRNKNPYVFGLPGNSQKRLSACSLMRKFSVVCGAKQPNALRGTELRKHIATQSVHYNLQDNEVTDLADFLGHAEKIHRTHYRLPVATREITKISRILEKAEGNSGEHICADSIQDTNLDNNICDFNMESGNFNHIEEVVVESENIDTENISSYNTTKRSIQDNNLDKVIGDFNMESGNLNLIEEVVVDSANIEYYEDSDDSVKDPMFVPTEEPTQEGAENKVSKRRRVFTRKRVWTTEEKQLVNTLFENNIKTGKLPSYAACKNAVKTQEQLKSRTAKQLYAFLSNNFKKKDARKPKRKVERIPWNTPEKIIVNKYFRRYIEQKKLPPYHLCSEVINNHEHEMKRRTSNHLYAYINNQIKKNSPNKCRTTSSPLLNSTWVSESPSKLDIRKWFHNNIKMEKIPTPVECADAIIKLPTLQNKNVNYVQECVNFEIKKKTFLKKTRRQLF